MNFRAYIEKNCNIPNVLTLFRLILVPVFLIIFAEGYKYFALFIFLLASFTDWLDGTIARKYNIITDFGKIMDPLADKIMVSCTLFCMSLGNEHIIGVIPWYVVVVVITKEILMVIGSSYLLKQGVVVHSLILGKIAQCLFILGLVLSFFHDYFVIKFPNWLFSLDIVILWLATICTLCALVHYCIYAYKNWIKQRENNL